MNRHPRTASRRRRGPGRPGRRGSALLTVAIADGGLPHADRPGWPWKTSERTRLPATGRSRGCPPTSRPESGLHPARWDGTGGADPPPPPPRRQGNGHPSHLFLQNGGSRLPVPFGATRATSVRPARPQAERADPPTTSVSREQTETGGAIVVRCSIARGRG